MRSCPTIRGYAATARGSDDVKETGELKTQERRGTLRRAQLQVAPAISGMQSTVMRWCPCTVVSLPRTSTLSGATGSLLLFSVPSATAQDAAAAQTTEPLRPRRLRLSWAVLADACDATA